jgi:arsenate reductase-like glutaredoxin family protein
MNRINLRQLVKKAQLLDNDGNYREADKVFNLVKLSQQQIGEFPLLPNQYQEVIPEFSDSYLSYNLNPKNAPTSTFGKSLVNRPMYDANSAFYEGTGPEKALVLKMPSEKQYAKLMNEGRFEEVQAIKSKIGRDIQEYLTQSNINASIVSTVIDQWLTVESPAAKEAFIQYVLPTSIVKLVSDDLAASDMKDWTKKLGNAFDSVASKDQTAYSAMLTNLSKNLQSIINAKKATAQGFQEVKSFFQSNEGRVFASKYNVSP